MGARRGAQAPGGGGQVRRRQANLRGPPIAVRPRRVDGPLPRAANGTLLPGSQLNAGGRPRGALDEFRAKFNPRMPEIAEVLLGLLRSQNESIRLSAAHEILNRLIGKPSTTIDTTHTRIDVAQMYLAALKRANGVIDDDNSRIGAASE